MKPNRTISLLAALASIVLLAGCGSSSSSSEPPVVTPPPPPAPTVVIGSIGTATTSLDQFASVELVPVTGDPVVLAVGADGSFEQAVAAGDYTVLAARPGYAPVELPLAVVANQENTLTVTLEALPAMTYIGHNDCAVCHQDYFDGYILSGHPNKILKVVDGEQPQYPPFVDRTPFFNLLEGSDCLTGDPIDGGRTPIDCPTSWDDVAYTLGGTYKLRFILKDGYVMSGTKAQYDVPGTSYIMNRFPSEGNASAYNGGRYDCGVCHTTGYQHTTASNPHQQDDLPGIRGTWEHEGVQCEACHGAGSSHAQSGSGADITRKAGARRTLATLQSPTEGKGQAISCYECHGRDSNRNLRGTSDWPSGFDQALANRGIVPAVDPQGGRIIPAGNGLVRARVGDQTWTYWPAAPAAQDPNKTAPIPVDQELSLARSANFLSTHGDCALCHDPHASTRAERFLENDWYTGPEGVDRSNEGCLFCHSLHDPQKRVSGGMKGLQCVDCHAPYVAGTGVNWPGAGTRPTMGDIPAHIWRIDLGLERSADDPLPQYTNQLLETPAKSGFIYPYMTADWACRTCHHDQAAVPGLNDVDVPGSSPALFDTSDEFLKAIGFKFHNNLP